MTTKKTISKERTALDAIKENKDEDKLYPVEDQEQFEEEGNDPKPVQVLVIDDGSDKCKLLLHELKTHPHIGIQTIVKDDLTDIIKTLPDKIKKEQSQGNKCNWVYIPCTNDQMNTNEGKLRADLAKLNFELHKRSDVETVTVIPYFDDHEEAEIERRIKQIK